MNAAIIVAGGKGARMEGDIRKQYLLLANRPILGLTLLLFNGCSAIDRILLVVPEDDIDFCQQTLLPPLKLHKNIVMVAGGPERQDSVYNGLKAMENADSNDIVAVHDGVRPFAEPGMISACISKAEQSGACIPGIPAFDTLKNIDDSTGRVLGTVDRKHVWLAQTPQVFQYSIIMEAHERAKKDGYKGTDDASLVERIDREVIMIRGSRNNIKITTKEDLLLAEAILAM